LAQLGFLFPSVYGSPQIGLLTVIDRWSLPKRQARKDSERVRKYQNPTVGDKSTTEGGRPEQILLADEFLAIFGLVGSGALEIAVDIVR
jgi:hypothetical protein